MKFSVVDSCQLSTKYVQPHLGKSLSGNPRKNQRETIIIDKADVLRQLNIFMENFFTLYDFDKKNYNEIHHQDSVSPLRELLIQITIILPI